MSGEPFSHTRAMLAKSLEAMEQDNSSRAVPGTVDQPQWPPGPYYAEKSLVTYYDIYAEPNHLWVGSAWEGVGRNPWATANLFAAAPDLYAIAQRALSFVNALPVPTQGATALGIALSATLRKARGDV